MGVSTVFRTFSGQKPLDTLKRINILYDENATYFNFLKCNPIKVSSSNADQNTNQTPGRKTSRRGNFIHKPADNVLSLKPASRSRSRSRSRIRNELANKLNSLIDDDEIESSVGPETLGTPKNAKKELISAVSTKTGIKNMVYRCNNPYFKKKR